MTTYSSTLTEREIEVLNLAAYGLTNVEIGKRLFIAPPTVKAHLSRIYGVLHASNRAAAVGEGYRQGILTIPHAENEAA